MALYIWVVCLVVGMAQIYEGNVGIASILGIVGFVSLLVHLENQGRK